MLNKNKITSFIIIIVCLIFGYLLVSIYRPFIYNNNINDYGIANIGNNFFSITFIYFIFYIIRKERYRYGKYKDIFYIFIILLIGELLSYYLKFLGTFDVKDIIGLIISCVLTIYLSKKLINDAKF